MKFIQRTIGAAILSVTFVLATGCDSPVGQMTGNLFTINGQHANDYFKGVMAQMNHQQQAQLQQQSPQTLQTLQHNDQLAKQQTSAPAAGQAAPAEEAPTPLKVDDIKAMAGAGIKPDAIVAAIKESKTNYSPSDIAAAEQITPPLDPSVISFMKSPTT